MVAESLPEHHPNIRTIEQNMNILAQLENAIFFSQICSQWVVEMSEVV